MYFVMAILTYLCAIILAKAVHGLTVPRKCDTKEENGYFLSCIRQWQLTDEIKLQPSAFLRKPHLFDEICDSRPGVSVDDVDTCVNESVSPWCDVIVESWKAYKTQVQTICKFRHEFAHLHKKCRTKELFLKAYDQCYNVYNGNKNSLHTCIGYKNLVGCLDNSLDVYCEKDSQQFFKMIFKASLQHHIEFVCNKYTKDVPKPVKTVLPIDDSYRIDYDDYNSRLSSLNGNNDNEFGCCRNTQMHEVNFSEQLKSSTNGYRGNEAIFAH